MRTLPLSPIQAVSPRNSALMADRKSASKAEIGPPAAQKAATASATAEKVITSQVVPAPKTRE